MPRPLPPGFRVFSNETPLPDKDPAKRAPLTVISSERHQAPLYRTPDIPDHNMILGDFIRAISEKQVQRFALTLKGLILVQDCAEDTLLDRRKRLANELPAILNPLRRTLYGVFNLESGARNVGESTKQSVKDIAIHIRTAHNCLTDCLALMDEALKLPANKSSTHILSVKEDMAVALTLLEELEPHRIIGLLNDGSRNGRMPSGSKQHSR
jgi:hypothetical protein